MATLAPPNRSLRKHASAWRLLGLLGLLGSTSACSKHARPPTQSDVPRNAAPTQISHRSEHHLLSLTLNNLSSLEKSIDFQVRLDGRQIWTGHARPKSEHSNPLNQQLKVAQGKYKLQVKSVQGEAQLQRELHLNGPQRVDISYRENSTQAGQVSPGFKITTLALPKPNQRPSVNAPMSTQLAQRPSDQLPKLPPGKGGHLLSITLSNQSGFPSCIDFKVFIDKQQIWSGDAEVEGGHNILTHEVKVSPGNHVITVKTEQGKATTSQDFRLDGLLYLDIAFWHNPHRTREMRPHFTLRQSLTPFGFG